MKGNIHLPEILAFLHSPCMEGPQQLRGYIPCNLTSGGTANYYGVPNPERYVPMGVSGVTIGTGVDLGQTNAAALEGMGVSGGVVNQLMPYLCKRKAAAVNVLHRLPLTVSKSVADELDTCMLAHHAGLAATRYDRDAGAGVFADLPWEAQAAIFSILYQRGTGSPQKYPNTWAAFVARDWRTASQKLCNGALWEAYRPRRAQEGKLLQRLL